MGKTHATRSATGGAGSGGDDGAGGRSMRDMAAMQQAQNRKRAKSHGANDEQQAKPEHDPTVIQAVSKGVVNVMHFGGLAYLHEVPPQYQSAVTLLYLATSTQKMPPDEKVRMMQSALSTLRPLLEAGKSMYATGDMDEGMIDSGTVLHDLEKRIEELQQSRAAERVDESILVGEGDKKMVLEDHEPEEKQREALKELLPKLRSDSQMMLETYSEALPKNDPLRGKLESALDVLDIYNSVLDISEADLKDKHGVLEGATAGSELMAKVMSATKSTLHLSMKAGELIAKKMGNLSLAKEFGKYAEGVGEHLGAVVEGVEVFHDIVTLIPGSGASTQEKIDAGVDLGAMGAGKLVGEAAGTAVTGSVLITYEGAKLLLESFGQTRLTFAQVGITQGLEVLINDADGIQFQLERLAKATLLAEREQDPAQKQALEQEANTCILDLGRDINGFIEDVGKPETSGHPTIARAFGDLDSLLSRSHPEGDLMAARFLLMRMKYFVDHANDLVMQAANRDVLDP